MSLKASLESIASALGDGATAEQKAAGAQACRNIAAVLEAQVGKPISSPGAPAASPRIPPDQMLDFVIARLRMAVAQKDAGNANMSTSGAAPASVPPTNDNASEPTRNDSAASPAAAPVPPQTAPEFPHAPDPRGLHFPLVPPPQPNVPPNAGGPRPTIAPRKSAVGAQKRPGIPLKKR